MKYTSELIVRLPLSEFVKKFDNADNMKHWQRRLQSIEHISGNPGMLGAKMKLKYNFGQRQMEIIETITHRKMPHEFHGTYSSSGLLKIQENYFTEIFNGDTKWTTNCEILPLTVMTRAMLWLMPYAFKKQSLQYMTDFKNFAENGISVANATT